MNKRGKYNSKRKQKRDWEIYVGENFLALEEFSKHLEPQNNKTEDK